MTGLRKTLTLSLAASDDNGICASQSAAGAAALTINGALASGGVATMDKARRVAVTSAGNDSGITFTVTGTDRYGRSMTEALTGSNASSVESEKDFLTVSSVATSGAIASTVIVGTTGVGSTGPMILDAWSNPADLSFAIETSGTVTWRLEKTLEDLSPSYDLNSNTPLWFSDVEITATNSSPSGDNVTGIIKGAMTMARLTIVSGTGTVTAHLMQAKSL